MSKFNRSTRGYVDPGTGMSFLSGIGGFILGFFALVFGAVTLTFKRWWGWLKSKFKKTQP